MSEETKKCPYCAETIKMEAIVCRYCGRDLLSSSTLGEPQETKGVLAHPKSKPICNYPGCEFEAEHKCSSCGNVFCLKHIAYYGQQWLCVEDLRKKANSHKQIATVAFIAGVIGLLIFIASLSGPPRHNESEICLGFILLIGGLFISSAMVGGYFSVQRSLRQLFPEEEIMRSKKDSLVNVPSLGEVQITKAEFTKLTYRQKFAVTEYGYLLSPEDAETVGKMLGSIVEEKDILPFCQANGKKILSFEQ